MSIFLQFLLIELSTHDMSVFSFLDNTLSTYQCIFTKLGRCIDNVKIWYGIDNRQI